MRRKFNKVFQSKAMLVMLLAGLLVVAAVAGTKSLKNGEEDKENQYIDLNEPAKDFAQSENTTQEFAKQPETTTQETKGVAVSEPESEPQDAQANAEVEKSTTKAETEPETEEPKPANSNLIDNVVNVPELSFSDNSAMTWPMEGNVVLGFSMDSTIYFPTLDLYKCNPGIVIQGEVGTTVKAPAEAKVVAVEYNEEIGNFVVLDLGNQYQVKCGQLDQISVAEGDYVQAGDAIGCIAEPTKYYVVEGSNLYFSVTKDGIPVDPLDYIK